jgi:hypothetical protein
MLIKICRDHTICLKVHKVLSIITLDPQGEIFKQAGIPNGCSENRARSRLNTEKRKAEM